ncbi:helix-turn-helix domain-containing protein [Cognatishimia sp. MH4019]|uniref:helix-turn-helix domain-containing protein n=1 Tax=Cognatishimia sp. MH4019 TaxID=2854030 RepID=UPI001CD4B39B|nr:helix-turn-helix domain-containing protein [Cognatishimia sp. MH4019]
MPKILSVRIAEVCRTIESDLGHSWRMGALATQAGMAPHHFQRSFAAVTGETVAGYIRSRRLERAALALRDTPDRIIDIALETGFQTHAGLTRAFTAHFGISPRDFRQKGLPPQNEGLPPRPYLRPLSSRTLISNCDLVEIPDQWMCCRQTKGVQDGVYFSDIESIHHDFKALGTELGSRNALLATAFPEGPKGYNDPDATALYGAIASDRFDLAWSSQWRGLPGGLFAVFPHFGPFSTLHLSWHRSVRAGFDQLGVAFRPSWMFETYLSARPDAPKTEISALIFLPVQKSTIGKARDASAP